jgi:hypothetical protein
MDHGKSNKNIMGLPVRQYPEEENSCGDSNAIETERTTRIITIKETSQTAQKFWLWNGQELGLQEDRWKIVKLSKQNKVQKPSPQVFFWEALMTVALLIMALWMQSLPVRQIPEIIEGNTLPSFETIEPHMEL